MPASLTDQALRQALEHCAVGTPGRSARSPAALQAHDPALDGRTEAQEAAIAALHQPQHPWQPRQTRQPAPAGQGLPQLHEGLGATEDRTVLATHMKARQQLGDVSRYATEVAEHKRDPYTLVEEIVGKLGKDTESA